MKYDFKYVENALKVANKLHDWYQDYRFYEESYIILKRYNSVHISNRINETKERYGVALKIINFLIEDECKKNNIPSSGFWYKTPEPDPYQRQEFISVEDIHLRQLKDRLFNLTEKIPLYVLLENGIDVVKDQFLEWVQVVIKNELQKTKNTFG
ncbi:MAG: hypothetical protein FWE90_08785 [Defluviitaleaceae bacterium]|nr:hypothetical protein [Defluviitaleaceae bacterium]